MIPVLFMETIPSLYNSLTKLVYGVTLLIGRVVCERFRRSKGYVPLLVHVCILHADARVEQAVHTDTTRDLHL